MNQQHRATVTVFLMLIAFCSTIQGTHALNPHANENSMAQVNYPDGISLLGEEKIELQHVKVTVKRWIALSEYSSLTLKHCNITLIVNPSETRPYENDITLSDKANLRLLNCSFTLKNDLNPSYYAGGIIQLDDAATLYAENATFFSTDQLAILCSGNSELILSKSTFTGISPRASLHYGLEDRTFEGLLSEFHEHYHISGYENSSIRIVGSRVGRVGSYGNSTLTVEESSIHYLDEGASMTQPSVSGSIISMFALYRYNSSIKILEPLEGHHERWDSGYLKGKPIGFGSLLINSTIENVWLSLINCRAELEAPHIKILSVHGGNLTALESDVWLLELGRSTVAKVSNSRVEYLLGFSEGDLKAALTSCRVSTLLMTCRKTLHLNVSDSVVGSCYVNHRWWSSEDGEIAFTRCSVGNLGVSFTPLNREEDRFLRLSFEDSILLGNFTIKPTEANDHLLISGALRFGIDAVFKPEGSSKDDVIRQLSVEVTNAGAPLVDASVKVLDGDEVVWEGATEATGVCSFNLGLANSKGVEPGDDWMKYVLIVESSGYEYRRSVGFTSDTPITIETRAYTRPYYELLAIAGLLILSVTVLHALRRIQKHIRPHEETTQA